MKIYIYLKGIEHTKDSLYQLSEETLNQKEKPDFLSSIQRGYVSYEDNEKDISVYTEGVLFLTSHFKGSVELIKCLGHYKKDALFFLIRPTGEGSSEILAHLIPITDKKIKRHFRSCVSLYERENKRDVDLAKISAMDIKVSDIGLFLINLAAFILSITLLYIRGRTENTAEIVLIISSLISLSSFIPILIDKYKKLKEFSRNFELTSLTQGLAKDTIIQKIKDAPSPLYKDFKFMEFKDSSNGIKDIFQYSDIQNKSLEDNGFKIPVKLRRFKHTPSLDSKKALAYVISEKTAGDKAVFNGKLLGICTDLKFEKVKEIKLKKVRYHEYVSTDELIYKNIVLGSDPAYYLAGYSLCTNPTTGGLKDIAGSCLTNLIGINLIVELDFNGEICLIINQQSSYTDANSSRLVPSASGSLEQSDFKKAKKKNGLLYFKDLLKEGMLRELAEESFLDKPILSSFSYTEKFNLLGFARLFSKGGKPDFFGALRITFKEERKTVILAILKNYNKKQNEIIFKNKYLKNRNQLENNSMLILERSAFLADNASFDAICSPQLEYIKYLLKKNK